MPKEHDAEICALLSGFVFTSCWSFGKRYILNHVFFWQLVIIMLFFWIAQPLFKRWHSVNLIRGYLVSVSVLSSVSLAASSLFLFSICLELLRRGSMLQFEADATALVSASMLAMAARMNSVALLSASSR